MNPEQPDPAAVFACALSLHEACIKRAEVDTELCLSESCKGMDQFMRELMRIATSFEAWACEHIDFADLDDVWPYFLEDRFGEACLDRICPGALAGFGPDDCYRVALHLKLPIRWAGGMGGDSHVRARNSHGRR